MLNIRSTVGVAMLLTLSTSMQLVAAQTPKSNKPAAAANAGSKRAELPSRKKITLPEAVPLAELSNEQLDLANRVALGKMPCELGAHVTVRPDVRGAGRFVLELGKQQFAMVPVASKTGAIRLEDEAAGVVWLQLANKSMLMSQKQGKRLADACANAEQLIVAKDLERNPAPGLLDAPVVLQAAGTPPNMSVATQAPTQ
jgi:hypothetical protein